jgi:hypothetical protein
MPERWVSDESQSYYLDSEADPEPFSPPTWALDADLTSTDNPVPFCRQHDTNVHGTTPFSDAAHQHVDYPGADRGDAAMKQFFAGTTTISPLSDQYLGVGLTPKETCSNNDFGPYSPSTWVGDANLGVNALLEESMVFPTHLGPTGPTSASFQSTLFDPIHYQRASALVDPSAETSALSVLPIRGIDVELARQDIDSASLTEVAHDILSNSFACALDRPGTTLRRNSTGYREFVDTASGQRKKRKKLGAKDQQMVGSPVHTSSTPHRLDDTFAGPLVGLKVTTGYNTSLPKSRFDMYIAALRQLVRDASETHFLE